MSTSPLLPRVSFVLLALLAACATPEFAQFAPLPAKADGQRVSRPLFSIVVPAGWEQRGEQDADGLRVVETPPPNGHYLVFRTMTVTTAQALVTDDDDALAGAALAQLTERHAKDALEVQERGKTQLGGRDAWFVRGTIDGGAAGWRFDVLDYFVPGDPVSLVLTFTSPAPQLAASRAGFGAIAASLQTTLGAPKFTGGELLWLAGDRFGLRVPATWQRDAEVGGDAAAFTNGDARCEVSMGKHEGDALARFVAERTAPPADVRDFRVLSIERRTRGSYPAARVRAAWRTDAGTVIGDDLAVLASDRVDLVRFRVPGGSHARLVEDIERIVASLRAR